ncbi:hypothetical protein [Scleromatobacter humisilvae]|uniref:Excinuclease ATPase subunit n=1 Tax=Scleromatobacter humisilvae TaxID=2897159 RepID=A0A9X1YSZ3_9BURK|nr:hypothetical protein [Scleromatobacter humisilvae]MCK9689046.1 hypothetical protein [Scleromatobacter humisilvae]
MNQPASLVRATLVGLSALVLASFAQARNETFMQPVAAALHKSYSREVVGDLPILWGVATAPQAGAPELIGTPFIVEGSGSATGDDPRKHETLSDEAVCNHAFKSALAKLVDAARDAHAGAVVGVVSAYKGSTAIDDGKTFECHAGVAWSHVFLRAQLVKSLEGTAR